MVEGVVFATWSPLGLTLGVGFVVGLTERQGDGGGRVEMVGGDAAGEEGGEEEEGGGGLVNAGQRTRLIKRGNGLVVVVWAFGLDWTILFFWIWNWIYYLIRLVFLNS